MIEDNALNSTKMKYEIFQSSSRFANLATSNESAVLSPL